MHSGFYLIFWGVLLQYNIVIRGFDILPDIIGYVLIFKGLKIIAEESKYFQTAGKLVLPLIPLSLINFYNFQYHPDLLLSIFFFVDALKAIVFALNMYLIFNICSGAIQIAHSISDKYLETTIRQRMYLFLGIAGAVLLTSLISLVPSLGFATVLQPVIFLVSVVYLFALLILVSGMYRMYKELTPKPVQPEKTAKPRRAKVKREKTK